MIRPCGLLICLDYMITFILTTIMWLLVWIRLKVLTLFFLHLLWILMECEGQGKQREGTSINWAFSILPVLYIICSVNRRVEYYFIPILCMVNPRLWEWLENFLEITQIIISHWARTEPRTTCLLLPMLIPEVETSHCSLLNLSL